MKDLLESIRLQIHERLSSPLFGAFVLSWLCWNHQYIMILFANVTVDERVRLAQTFVYPSEFVLWMKTLWGPAATTLGFILIYPYPSRWLFSYWHRRQVELKALRDKIEDAEVLTREESRAIILRSVNERKDLEETIRRQATELEALRRQQKEPSPVGLKEVMAENESLRTELARRAAPPPPSRPFDSATKETREGVHGVLGAIINSTNQRILEPNLLGTGPNAVRIRYFVDKAMEWNFVQTGQNQNGVPFYTLTAAGRQYIVDNGLA